MKDFFPLGEHVKMVTIIYIIVLIFICFYFFKYFKIIDNQLKFLLILLFFFFIYAILYSIEEDQNVTLLKNNYSLTTGNVEEYFVPKIKGRNSYTTVKYIYQVNNDFFENQYQQNYYVDIPDDKPDLSILYLIIYEKTNPKNSFILLNYPINSSTDLEKYKEMFKHEIPANAIKQN